MRLHTAAGSPLAPVVSVRSLISSARGIKYVSYIISSIELSVMFFFIITLAFNCYPYKDLNL